MNDKLFVYGTLLDEDNKYGVYLRDNSDFFSTGRLKGRLYDVGEYPAAVLNPDGENYIHGIVLKMDEPAAILSLLDIYEGFGEDQPQPNEFVRVLAEAETGADRITCWIYLYNLPTNNLLLIENGRYIK